MDFKILVACLACVFVGFIQDSDAVPQPRKLEKLLNSKKYSAFSKITRVPKNLVKPVNVDEDTRLNLNIEQIGDLMFLPEQLYKKDGSNESHYNGLLFGKWNRVVPYAIIKTNYTPEDIATIEANIQSFNSHFVGVIEFRPQTPEDENYVAIFNGNGCFTHVGQLGGVQAISLKSNFPSQPCLATGWQHHEMMHTIGMMHTTLRVDRDFYIKIRPENLVPGLHRLYYDIIPDVPNADPKKTYFEIEGPYEYESIMQLPPYLFPDQKEPNFDILRSDIDPHIVGDTANIDITPLDELMVKNFYRDVK